ncbi:MAG: alpha-glucosidase [Bacilli bacterium]|nr:alpha-glucosidase [Bacilli bacterium]
MKRTNWYKDAIIYQIYPRSFKDTDDDGFGDIKGIIEKLDYLKELGVTCVWLSPIYNSPQEDNGYDISDYFNIYPPFGTLDDFKLMIKGMHERGIKLIMDLVVNHTSSEHAFFQDVLKNPNSPYKDYYIIKKGKKNGKKPPNNWTGFFGEKAWEKLPYGDEYYLHLFAKGQPDLNWENIKVREYVKSILKFWLDLGVDGFRCDVINLISKKQDFKSKYNSPFLIGKEDYINGPRLHEFLHELYEDVYSHYDSMTVGETVLSTLDDAILLTKEDREELSMIFNFDHVDVDGFLGIKWLKRRFSLRRWKKIYKKWQEGLYLKGWNSLFIENHDQRRSIGRFNTDEGKYRLESSKALAATYFLMQGTPFIYQGQEIGMGNPHFKSLDEIKDVETHNINRILNKIPLLRLWLTKNRLFEYSRDNARTPILWDDSIYGGFSNVRPWLDVNKDKTYNARAALSNKNSLFYHYQSLIELKKKYKVLKDGKYIPLLMKDKQIFMYKRCNNEEEIVVISNFSKKLVKRKKLKEYNDYELLLGNYMDKSNIDILRPYESKVLYRKK